MRPARMSRSDSKQQQIFDLEEMNQSPAFVTFMDPKGEDVSEAVQHNDIFSRLRNSFES